MFIEAQELTEDVRRAFEELDRAHAEGCRPVPGECAPPLDVYETAAGVEIRVDLPGIRAERLRLLLKGSTVLIVGDKLPPPASAPVDAAFHLVERRFGRFARVVRLTGAFDAAGARAVLAGGELQVALPRRTERRGREIAIPIETRA